MTRSSGNFLESLESRRLLSGIGVSHRHILDVIGGGATNTITVGLSPDQQSIVADVSYPLAKTTKHISATFPVTDVIAVLIRGGHAADLITIDQTNGSFTLPVQIIASDGNDSIYGGDEPDDIMGGTGNDYIDAGGGLNRVNGQAGNDTVIGGAGTNVFLGGAGDDSLVGGAGNDTLLGQGGNDTILGNDGDDLLRGGNGTDSLSGGEGNDTINNLGGRDTMMGGDGTNTFVVHSIKRNPTNDYVAAKDSITRVPTQDDSSSFWGDLLESYLI